MWIEGTHYCVSNERCIPLGFPSWSLGHFLLSVFPVESRPRMWLVPCLRPQHWPFHSMLELTIGRRPHSSLWGCIWVPSPADPLGSCSTQEFKLWKTPKKELTCCAGWSNSSGWSRLYHTLERPSPAILVAHIVTRWYTFDIFKEWPHFWVRFKGLDTW